MSETPDDVKRAILDLLLTASRLERTLDRRLANLRGISFSEYQLIRQLAAAPGAAASRVDLADAVGLTPSAVTRAIKPLEKLGYISTERSERDARKAMATLTPAGHELLTDAEAAMDDSVDSITMTPTELRELDRLLATVRDLR